jgi:dTDP-4-amino-4,6-dideoxygalactose transaminase
VANDTLIRFVDLVSLHEEIRDELRTAIDRVIKDGRFILGPEVEALEKEFAQLCGVDHGIGTNSGTSALHLALLAAGIGPGDEVITVSLTFWATVAAIIYTGATPVLVDVDPQTCNLDPSAIEGAITKRTKAVMPVHLYGRCADMDAITRVARQHGLLIVEDAAQAAGSTYMGRPAGSLGDIACFSFYPAKNLGAIGEGGMVVTSNSIYADKVRMLRDHGSQHKYSHELLGYNYRLEAIQATAIRVKLKRLAKWNTARQSVAAEYRKSIKGAALLAKPDNSEENHHIFPVFSSRRNQLREQLERSGIETGIHYPVPSHMQPAFLNRGWGSPNLPVTELVCREVLSIPMHPHLMSEDVTTVAAAINSFADSN